MTAGGLDLFRLLVLVTVVERNGYSAAAEHLNVSQATVSFHVQALERFFGATLLDCGRTATPISSTLAASSYSAVAPNKPIAGQRQPNCSVSGERGPIRGPK